MSKNSIFDKNIQRGRIKSAPIICLVLTAIIFSILFFVKVDVLLLKSYPLEKIYAVRKIDKDSYIGIIYTHSVEKTETSEWYRVGDGELILMEERYQSQGAGLPTDMLYKFRKDKTGFVLYDINKPFKSFVYRTGAVIANHRLNIDGKEEAFSSFSKPRDPVCFSVSKISLIKFLIWRYSYG